MPCLTQWGINLYLPSKFFWALPHPMPARLLGDLMLACTANAQQGSEAQLFV